MHNIMPAGTSSASVVCGFILEALGASDTYNYLPMSGLPASTIFVPEHDALISVTSAAEPLFRAQVKQVAAELHADVLLLRVGELEDALLPVTVDAALGALPCQPWVEHDLALWTDHRSIWLVPHGFGPSISVAPDGLCVELLPPYPTLAQRSAGIFRAANALACLLSPAETH